MELRCDSGPPSLWITSWCISTLLIIVTPFVEQIAICPAFDSCYDLTLLDRSYPTGCYSPLMPRRDPISYRVPIPRRLLHQISRTIPTPTSSGIMCRLETGAFVSTHFFVDLTFDGFLPSYSATSHLVHFHASSTEALHLNRQLTASARLCSSSLIVL